jgi:hypothetical protein
LGGFSAIFFGLTRRVQRPGEEVVTENPFEIPQALRDVAEQNMKQAHAAYEQLTDFVTKAMDAWMGATHSSSTVTDFNLTGFEDVQDRAVAMATKNADSAFALIEKIAKAQTFQDVLTLQMKFAQDRVQAFATQTQELHRLIGEAFQRSASR